MRVISCGYGRAQGKIARRRIVQQEEVSGHLGIMAETVLPKLLIRVSWVRIPGGPPVKTPVQIGKTGVYPFLESLGLG